jgi:hypothetical protein
VKTIYTLRRSTANTKSGHQYSLGVPQEIGEELDAAQMREFSIEIDEDGITFKPITGTTADHRSGLRRLLSNA